MDKVEARAVVRFLTLEGTKASEIAERMHRVYGEIAPGYESVKRWAREFRLGRVSLKDEEKSGRPKTAKTTENIEAVQRLVMHDRRITVVQIAEDVGIAEGTVHSILHEDLGMGKVSCRWVPKVLKDFDKENRVTTVNDTLA